MHPAAIGDDGRLKSLRRIATAFIALLLSALPVSHAAPSAPASALAHTYYVDATVSDPAGTNPGTSQQPFGTIQKAADTAQPGDTILIRPGVYKEQVLLHHGGEPGRPITLQATVRHGVEITGRDSDWHWLMHSVGNPQHLESLVSRYVTLRGIVFSDVVGPLDWNEAVTMADGWRMEDCVVKGGPGYLSDGIRVRGDDCTILRTISEDNGMNGMAGDKNHNLRIQDCVLRRNNRLPEMPGGNCGACKFLYTTGLRVDGIVSYDNFGSGWWLDWDNVDYHITNSTFFGNHGGTYRYNHPDRKEFGEVQSADWSGVGIWSEGNPGPGLIANNTIYSNLACGIGVLESGFKAPITVRGNTIVDCGRCVELRAMLRGDHVLGQVDIEGNRFKAWRDDAVGTSLEDTIKTVRPATIGITINGNDYDSGRSEKFVSWYDKADDKRIATHSLLESQQDLGIEANGTLAHVPFPAQLIPVRATTLADWTDDRTRVDDVPRAPEDITIDGAISAAKARLGSNVVIPLFGRKAIMPGRPAVAEGYDLDARYVRMILSNASAAKAVATGIPQFATITPTYVMIRLTKVDPYDIEGTFVRIVKSPAILPG